MAPVGHEIRSTDSDGWSVDRLITVLDETMTFTFLRREIDLASPKVWPSQTYWGLTVTRID